MSDEDFTNYPQSLAEVKAQNEKDATAWTPRDVLLGMLRDLDSGAIEAKELVVSYRGRKAEDPPKHESVYYRVACKKTHSAVGILAIAQQLIFTTSRGDGAI